MSKDLRQKNNPRNTTVVGPDGRKIALSSLPLVAFGMHCGHLGRDYGVVRRDLVFCQECKTSRRVTKILAQ